MFAGPTHKHPVLRARNLQLRRDLCLPHVRELCALHSNTTCLYLLLKACVCTQTTSATTFKRGSVPAAVFARLWPTRCAPRLAFPLHCLAIDAAVCAAQQHVRHRAERAAGFGQSRRGGQVPHASIALEHHHLNATAQPVPFSSQVALLGDAQHDDRAAAARPVHGLGSGAEIDLPAGRPGRAGGLRAGLAGFEAKSFRGLGIMASTPVRPPPALSPLPPLTPLPCLRSTRCRMIRTLFRCSSGPRRSASSTACRRRRRPDQERRGRDRSLPAQLHGHYDLRRRERPPRAHHLRPGALRHRLRRGGLPAQRPLWPRRSSGDGLRGKDGR